MKNKGRIYLIPNDNRKVVLLHNQPLLATHNKLVFHLVDDDYNYIIDDKTNKPKTITKSKDNCVDFKQIGFID